MEQFSTSSRNINPNRRFYITILAFIIIVLFQDNTVWANPTPSFFTPVAPVIDGEIDSIFYNGLKFSNFKQIEPTILADASVKTEIFFLHTQEHVFIAGKLYQQRNTLKASAGRRDAKIITEGDLVIIALDPLNNGNAANFFIINPVNAIADGVMMNSNFDFSWDGIFQSAVTVNDEFWTFEFQLPISAINFQKEDVQTWGVNFMRVYAQQQEKSIYQLLDKNNPLRIDDFFKIEGIKDLRRKQFVQFIPYVFSSASQDKLASSSETKLKSGGEVRYKPLPSMTIIGTVNPDFAQIETDAVIINVNDVPVSMPERRPFFTESSDLYQGLAVNTRNIKEMNAGMKLRQVQNNFKYDVTWVNDKENNHWLLSNSRYSNNKTFHGEIISGIKKAPDFTHYNITSHLRGWALQRRLTFYNWIGTINMPLSKNEFETVNSIQWVSRNLLTGVWSHLKSEMYNPNVTGHNTLSNENIIAAWFNYTFFPENKNLRRFTADIKAEQRSLHTNTNTNYYILYPRLNALVFLNKNIGTWEFNLNYRPGINNYFRYRNFQNGETENTYRDAFGKFRLINQNRDAFAFTTVSDYSKRIGFTLHYNNYEVRRSVSNNFKADVFWKISPKLNIAYSLEHIGLQGSEYQPNYKQTFNRVKGEYNITSKVNIRSIFQFNRINVLAESGFIETMPLANFTASWEYSKGSFIYLVINKYHDLKIFKPDNTKQHLINGQLIGFKINKTFTL